MLLAEPAHAMLGPVAQLVEHGTENAGVGGSTPPWATNSKKKRFGAFFLRRGQADAGKPASRTASTVISSARFTFHRSVCLLHVKELFQTNFLRDSELLAILL